MLTERSNQDLLQEFFLSAVHDNSGIPQRDLLPEFRVADGDDSFVYSTGKGEVLKFYTKRGQFKGKLGRLQLELYRDITNVAAGVTSREHWQIDFPDSHVTVPVRVNPYTDLLWSDQYKCWIGICPFIGGERFDNWRQDTLIRPYERYKSLNELSARLNNRLEVEGIKIIPLNTKLIGESNNLSIIVTDLCAAIWNLASV